MHEKFTKLREALEASLIEREEEVYATLLALISQEHLVFVGEPGTAKSLLLRSVCASIEGAKFVERLMFKDTSRDELFGFYDMELVQREKRWERSMEGNVPTADVVFLDEFFKASSFSANMMLGVMQERVVFDGKRKVSVPLRTLVAASNEWPIGEDYQEWGAIFDRFLIRKTVKRVSDDGEDRLLFDTLPEVVATVTLEDCDRATEESRQVLVSKDAAEALSEIRRELKSEGIRPTNRRLRKSVSVAKAAAWLDGAAEVRPIHLECLQWVLWDDPQEQPQKVAEIICKIANPVGAEITSLLGEAEEILVGIGEGDITSPETFSGIKKLKELGSRFKSLESSGNGRAVKAREYVTQRVGVIQKKMLGVET